jgi:hypothetical protein
MVSYQYVREKEAKGRFDELRNRMREIYTSWSAKDVEEVLRIPLYYIPIIDDGSQDSVIISRQALERWLCKPLAKLKTKPKVADEAETIAEILPASDILCDHDALDPQKANNMKRVSAVSPLRYLLLGTKFKQFKFCRACIRSSPSLASLIFLQYARCRTFVRHVSRNHS